MSEGPSGTDRPGPDGTDGAASTPASPDSPASPAPTRSHRQQAPRATPGTDAPPWERPKYWSASASDTRPKMEPTRVDDLLARLGSNPDATPPVRRRRANESQTVAASELLAAFSDDDTANDTANDTDIDIDDSDATTLLTHPDPVPPRIGPNDPAPIRDLSTDSDAHTEEIPKLSGADDDAQIIRASLAARAGSVATVASPAAAAGSDSGDRPPPDKGNRAPAQPPLHRHPRWLLGGRIAVAAVMAVIVTMVGWNWKIVRDADRDLQSHSLSGALNTTDPNIIAPTAGAGTVTTQVIDSKGNTVTKTMVAPVAPKVYQAENVLLIGSDTRADGNGNSSNSDGNEVTAQSDTLMIAHLSADRQHVTVLSIPRDTKVPAPTCHTWDSTTGKVSDTVQPVSDGDTWKITNAYAVGGPTCTVAAVQKLSGIKIDRLIGIDFNGFKNMVDAVGGITINICRPIIDRVLHTVVPTAGLQTIVGDEALNLVRARDVIGDNLSDLARIHRQQLVLSALLRQVSSAQTLLNPNKLSSFLKAFTGNTFNQNVTLNDLVDLASSLGNLNPGQVTFFTMPTNTDPTDPDSLVPDAAKAAAVFDAIRNDETLPGQTTVATTPKTTPKVSASASKAPASKATTSGSPAELVLAVAPSAVALQVYNVTGATGIGSDVEAKLNALGFQVSDNDVVRPDNATQAGITVQYSDGNRAAALTVAAAVPGATLEQTAGLGNTVRLMVGSSYRGGDFSAVRVGQTAPSSVLSSAIAGSLTTSAPTTSSPATTSAVPSTVLNSSDLTPVNAATSTCA